MRLLWPQWQGAGTVSVRDLAPEFPFEMARRGYAIGSAVLATVLPVHDGTTGTAPVALDDSGPELRDGIEAKDAILAQLAQGLAVIRQHDPARIVTLGREPTGQPRAAVTAPASPSVEVSAVCEP